MYGGILPDRTAKVSGTDKEAIDPTGETIQYAGALTHVYIYSTNCTKSSYKQTGNTQHKAQQDLQVQLKQHKLTRS